MCPDHRPGDQRQLQFAGGRYTDRRDGAARSARCRGVTRKFGILPARPSDGWNIYYIAGRRYDDYLGALLALYRARGVSVIPTAALDWVGAGLVQDGLHPNDLGQARMCQIVVEALSA